MMTVLPATACSVISSGLLPRSKPSIRTDPRSPASRISRRSRVWASRIASSMVLTGTQARAPLASAAHIVVVARSTSMTNTVLPATSIRDSPAGVKATSILMRGGTQERGVPLQELGVDLPRHEFGIADDSREEGDRGGHPFEDEAVQRLAHPRQRLGPIAPVHDDLGEERIVVRRHRVPGVDVGVDPHARTAGRMVRGDETGTRLEVPIGIFGVHPALDRMAAEAGEVSLRDAHRLTRGDADLLLHQVEPCHHFGDRMLYLDPGVHLHEVEALVLIEQELDGPRADVVDRRREPHRGLAHRAPELVV